MPPFTILANLDAEATWAGAPLPPRVQARISAASALLAVLAPDGADVEVWAPAAVDAARLRMPSPPRLRVGVADRWDLAWADPGDRSRAFNDRRYAFAIAQSLGASLPGACVVENLDAFERAIAASPGAWVCKAVWTAAGRDRCHGSGPATPDRRRRIARLIERAGAGAVMFEPWCERVLDFGVCGALGTSGRVIHAPHTLRSDPRGGFLGISLEPPMLEPAERARLDTIVTAVTDALARDGYVGAFGIDGFVYKTPTGRAIHAMCELNARYTFGHVARAIGERYGARELG